MAPLDNGIWRYDEGETAAPTFSDLFNRLGDSVRARFATLDTDWIDVALTGGATFNAKPQVCRIGQVVYWRGDVQRAHTTTLVEVITAAEIPPWALPSRSFRDATVLLPVVGFPNITATAMPAGGYGLRLATSSNVTGSVPLAGLSGYTVN